jgi:hypothetical protein
LKTGEKTTSYAGTEMHGHISGKLYMKPEEERNMWVY